MESGVNTILYPVRDPAKAKALFSALLGTEPMYDQPYYIGFRIGGQDIGLVPNGHSQGMTGTTGYYEVADIAAAVAQLGSMGAVVVQEPMDIGEGGLVALVQDYDGNMIGLKQTPSESQKAVR